MWNQSPPAGVAGERWIMYLEGFQNTETLAFINTKNAGFDPSVVNIHHRVTNGTRKVAVVQSLDYVKEIMDLVAAETEAEIWVLFGEVLGHTLEQAFDLAFSGEFKP